MAAGKKVLKWIFRALTLLLFFACTRTEEVKAPPLQTIELPKWTWSVLEAPSFKEKYNYDLRINPFYLQADFDKDGFLDIAVLIKEKSSSKSGLAILQQAIAQPMVFGAGQKESFGQEDWSWLKTWKTETVLPAGSGLQPTGPAIILFSKEPTQNAPWLYWTGKTWEWQAE